MLEFDSFINTDDAPELANAIFSIERVMVLQFGIQILIYTGVSFVSNGNKLAGYACFFGAIAGEIFYFIYKTSFTKKIRNSLVSMGTEGVIHFHYKFRPDAVRVTADHSKDALEVEYTQVKKYIESKKYVILQAGGTNLIIEKQVATEHSLKEFMSRKIKM